MKLIEAIVKYIPREGVPTWCSEFFVNVTDITGVPKRKVIIGVTSNGPFVIPSFSHVADIAEIGESVMFVDLMRAYDMNNSLSLNDDSEGWIEWKGGECPVEKGTLVDVKYRDGSVGMSLSALTDTGTSEEDARQVFWDNDDHYKDIIAYRLSNTDSCNCDGCTDGDDFVPFGDNGNLEKSSEKKDFSLEIITLISSVAPNVSVSDALEIASTLQEYGFKK